jgi:hypothetical protein
VSRIVCLHHGRVVADEDSDALRESFAEWLVTSRAGGLPDSYAEPFVQSAQGDGHRARLLVRGTTPAEAARFEAAHNAAIEARPLTLEQIFPLLTGPARRRAAGPAAEARTGARR